MKQNKMTLSAQIGKHFGEQNNIHTKNIERIHSFIHIRLLIYSIVFDLKKKCRIQIIWYNRANSTVRIQFTNLISIPKQMQIICELHILWTRCTVEFGASIFSFVCVDSIIIWARQFPKDFHSFINAKISVHFFSMERYVFIRFTPASILSTFSPLFPISLSLDYRSFVYIYMLSTEAKVSRSIPSHESIALHSIRSSVFFLL